MILSYKSWILNRSTRTTLFEAFLRFLQILQFHSFDFFVYLTKKSYKYAENRHFKPLPN